MSTEMEATDLTRFTVQTGQLTVSTVTLVAFTVGAREPGGTDASVTSVLVVAACCTVLTGSMRRTEVEICQHTTRRSCQLSIHYTKHVLMCYI